MATSCNKDCTEETWFEDSDGDGFGNALVMESACEAPANFVDNSDDVDDTNADLNPNTVWQGATATFTKADNSDWTLEANQDRITSNVWLTRQNNNGMFNIAIEEIDEDSDACLTTIPGDTEWAYGTTSEISTLTFEPLGSVIGCNFKEIVDGRDMVIHLITDNIYIDLKFTSWSSGGGGGGFSYERSTMN